MSLFVSLEASFSSVMYINWAVKKLRNGHRGEGFDDFVTFRYVYFEGGGGIV